MRRLTITTEGQRPVVETKAEGGVQSLHRAMAIMRAVAHARQGIGLADLAKEIGLHSSTTFHLAKTMVVLGLLRQESETKRYRVGPQLFSLATGALDEIELLSVANPFMAALAEETKESSHIAVFMGRDVVILGKVDGPASIRMAERVGTARPAHATAIGKVLLGGLSEHKLEAFLRNAPFDAVTSRTITERDALVEEIERARQNGIAFDDGEYDPDARCLAAPVFDFRGQLIAAIGITSPIWRLNLQRVASVEKNLKEAARDLSRQFGFEGE
jgi:DNA-binding IclR family transcriptional regulator